MSSGVKRVSKNTGFKEEHISLVKEHLFLKKHDLESGKNIYFYPDYDIAESWQRLIDGKNIQEHDLILIKHEYLEQALMNRRGLSQREAHSRAEKFYNYKVAVEKFIGGK